MAEMTPFALLGLPARFALNATDIEDGWRRAIAMVHPDRFASRPAAERRVAEQWAGRINEAKEAIENPVSRAVTLLKMRGVDVGTQTDTKMAPQFLMQQMMWREAAEAIRSADEQQQLLVEIARARDAEIAILTDVLDADGDLETARAAVRRLMFIDKIYRDVERETY